MADSWEERKKGLEEEYFRQKDNELILKMREKISARDQMQNYSCPKCDGSLQTGNFENVQIDICNKCGGVWLDAGELQQIIGEDNGQSWFGRFFS